MTDLFDRLATLFTASAHLGPQGLHDDARFVPPVVRPAAVLVAITDRPEPGVILTWRPETMASHPGQVAFPGGKIEPGETPVQAALREAEEELAIAPHLVRVIGTSTRFATGSGYELTPVLGVVPGDLVITPDPREVAGWFEAPLAHVLDPANHVDKVGLFRGHERPYVEIMWQDHRIWGITAGILRNLSHRLSVQELIR